MPEKLLDLTGKRILITGASGGIGRATARTTANLGGTVLAVGRNVDRLRETLRLLDGNGHSSRTLDFQDAERIPDIVEELVGESGPLDGIVHLAGMDETRPLKVCSPKSFELLYRVNVVAAAMLLKSLTSRGIASRDGCSAVLVGSVMALVGSPARSAYASSKAALLGLIRSSALELAGMGVRVNGVLPGYVDTEMTRQQQTMLTSEQIERIEKMHPLGLGQPEDVAHVVAFLLSGASRWMTGASVVVDGGYTAQ